MRRWCDENHCQLDQRHCQRLPIATLAHRLQLDRRWRKALCRQAAPGAYRPRQSVRRDGVDHGVPADHRSHRYPTAADSAGSHETNGLAEASRIMLDKVTTMPRAKLGDRIGSVSGTDMATLSRSLVVFLGLA